MGEVWEYWVIKPENHIVSIEYGDVGQRGFEAWDGIKKSSGAAFAAPLRKEMCLCQLFGDADFDVDGGNHVLGVIAVEVMDDEGHLAFFPFEAEVLGDDDEFRATFL